MNTQDIRNKVEQIKCEPKNSKSLLKGQRLTRHNWNVWQFGIVDDSIWTLDRYYIRLINDTLNSIRKKQKAWVFSAAQLKDILRFEPDVEFEYSELDNVIYIWR